MPRLESQAHLPRPSTMKPSSLRHGIQFPSSSKACPGGQTHSSLASKIRPRPGGQVLTGVHSSEASPSYPGKQIQIMVRTGRVSSTWHSAWMPHGSARVQGFKHWPRMQAVFEGQSMSDVQPTSTVGENRISVHNYQSLEVYRITLVSNKLSIVQIILPLSHTVPLLPWYPGGHAQSGS
jgi:hypothetical protein